MAYESSLSFHNDVTWNIEHDERTSDILPNNVNPEDCHENIYWEGNTTVEKFYDKYFEEDFQKYQKRLRKEDRFNGTYFEKLSKEQAEKEKIARDLKNQNAPYKEQRKANRFPKVAYQVVVTLGNCDENPEFKHGGSREEDTKQILAAYMNSFEERNPGMKMICGAIHCDEGDRYDADGNLVKVGGNIHLHLTYCPVAECTRGPKLQNSLNGAFRMMGIESDKTKDPVTGRYQTAQIKWQYRERDFLSELAKQKGINIISKGKGKERHLAVDDYQRKKEIDYINQSKKQIEERSNQLDIRENILNTLVAENPSIADVEEIINENTELFQRNDELEKRENSNQDFIQSIRDSYFNDSSVLWSERKRQKEELKSLIKEASANKRFDEARYKKLMDSVYNTSENILMRLLKFIFSLFFRYKLRKEEQQLQQLTEMNTQMKEKSKAIVEAGKELTAAFKTKEMNTILEKLEKWDYEVGKVEDGLYHKINIDIENERLKREEYEERVSRRDNQDDQGKEYIDDILDI